MKSTSSESVHRSEFPARRDSTSTPLRPTNAIVDLSCITHNIRTLRETISPGARQMAVIKADGYGHGAVQVARTAIDSGVDWLGIGFVEEGVEIRRARIDVPILVMCPLTPGEADAAVENSLAVTVCDKTSAEALAKSAANLGRRAVVHIKVDTGMGRWGLDPGDVVEYAEWLSKLPALRLEGIFSHFATAHESDTTFARHQLEVFRGVLDALEQRGLKPELSHMANTAASLALPESHFGLVRTGIGIYGSYPSPDMPRALDLKEAMKLTTHVAQVRDLGEGTPLSYDRTFVTQRPSRIAVLPIGYGDGYPRLLSSRGEVLVRGSRARVVGRVCMDAILVDVTDLPAVDVGDEVVLFGQQGDERISIDEIATHSGTINYEIMCSVGKRVPRVYV